MEHFLCPSCVFDKPFKQTQILVPAGLSTLFPDHVALPSSPSLCCPFLSSTQTVLLYYCISSAKVQCSWLCLFTFLIRSHCLIATWLQYSFIHFRARQVTERGTGGLIPCEKGAATAQLPLVFAMTEYRLGPSDLFSFFLFFVKEKPEIWIFM